MEKTSDKRLADIDSEKFNDSNHTFGFIRSGVGEKVMFTFHGFGQSGREFQEFDRIFGAEFTLYHFHLPFHGQLTHLGQPILTKDALYWFFSKFCQKKKIGKFSLAAFSLGSKLALSLLESFPQQVDLVILMAPDGIKNNFWYDMAVYPGLFRRLFRSWITNPSLFFFLLKLIKKYKLADKSTIKFAETQMHSRYRRWRVYNTWNALRALRFKPSRLVNLINQQQIPVNIYFGKYDHIITASHLQFFLVQLQRCHMKVLNASHRDLIGVTADELKRKQYLR
ncbi:MAG: alpha/beta fold hydrolase [Candidatus Cyclobacteriaceae bacterium M3_2C_046]